MLMFVAEFLTFMIIGRERFKHTLFRSLPAHDLSVTPRAIAFYIVGLRKILNTLSMMLAESLMMIVANIIILLSLSGDMIHCTALHKHANQGFYKKYFEGLAFRNTLAGGPPTIAGMVVLYRRRFWGTVKLIEKVKTFIKAAIAVATRQSRHISGNPSSSNHNYQ
ncbi:hypothetical protein DKX38_011594 [Salix brachista]|uniref:Uncharacterized protein n=1 Tax=Salix brachista TaxID=2182728 RepID=A0A5N5LZR3_9ROSI|nr:hypothetical protein DKX38_011594 [Salix brachista]